MVHPASHVAHGTWATPGLRLGRWRLRRPRTKGCRCTSQYPVAASIAPHTPSHVVNTRPFRASDFGASHHGSIRFRYAAYRGPNTNSHRGCHGANESTSVVRCVTRSSRIAYTRPTSAGTQPSTRPRKSTRLTPFRFSWQRV